MANTPSNATAITLASWGLVVHTDGEPDETATAAPTFSLASVTEDTATFTLTVPIDVDYDHCALYLTKAGESSASVKTPFTGSLAGLSSGTQYYATVCAFDGADEDTANRSVPSGVVAFRTNQTSSGTGGTYNITVEFWVDESDTAKVTQECSIGTDRHRVPIRLRGVLGQMRVTMNQVDQTAQFIGYTLDGQVLGRRVD